MSFACFETEGLSSERRLYIQVWNNLLTCSNISSLVFNPQDCLYCYM